ncbi:class I SAM-dependent methyltransferase [Candidatus Bathyarchaeota archaeon]|nr:class I SAM-dependent methyltransferase [Candidatus Bathyarchaeota archaeon]MBS7630415.1 class I SAM-dependent methyltransferase [Candidatus Bathyarchaeota archaeon]
MYYSGQSLAPYVASPVNVVKRMLEIAEVKPGETVYDLGCGDGRIVIIAAQEFGAKGVGVELNPNLVKESRAKVEELKLNDRVQIIQGDLMKVDLSQADVVTMYLTTGANEKIRPKLETELKSGARVVTHDFTIPKWNILQEIRFRDDYRSHTIYLYNKSKSMKIV